SLAFFLLAAVAANAGLWVVLHENQKAFLHHPQLWVVPLALVILGTGEVNRDRLTRPQHAALRYTALTIIYVASTAETFLGLGGEAWRPLLLIGLAVVGVLLGMVLRVRAFLYLGSGFVLMGVLALVWHAAMRGGLLVWLLAGLSLG